MNTEDRIRQFIISNFYVTDESVLTSDTSLIAGGIVDSTGILEVIAFIETELGATVSDDEMTPENLGSIGAIAAFVEQKRASTTPQ